nr:hypothetical protein [Pelagibacterium lacus]
MTVLDESAVDRSGARDRWGRQSNLGSGDNGDFLASSIIVAEVDDPPVGLDQRVRQVRVGAASLGMQNAASRLLPKAKFGFEVVHEGTKGVGVVPTDRRVNMNMVDRAGGASVRGTCNEASQLPGEVVSGKVTGLDKPDLLPASAGKQVPGESRSALSASSPGKHVISSAR